MFWRRADEGRDRASKGSVSDNVAASGFSAREQEQIDKILEDGYKAVKDELEEFMPRKKR